MYSRAPAALAAACLATLLSSAGSTARADSDDPAAIAKFLSIGFANAHDGFMELRGNRIAGEVYLATEWPDHTLFGTCRVFFSKTVAAYMYVCNSTLRSESFNRLLNIAVDAIQANLPSGYTSGPLDQGGGSGTVNQLWTKAGYPYVILTETLSDAGDGETYSIGITANH
jgi:hypothetical protein